MAKSLCIGSGLVSLDIVFKNKDVSPLMLSAGGSCGNVLTILSYLGWESKPVARLKNNRATTELVEDLKTFGVNTELISQKSDGSTPLIIHRIFASEAKKPRHRFEFRDPSDGSWLPRYKPVLASEVDQFDIKAPSVFYFDRVSRGTIELAKKCKAASSLVFFEPSSIGDVKMFRECLSVADVIKFSHERIENYDDLFPTSAVPLEIRTNGNEGLEFRLSKSSWQKLMPFKIQNDLVIDSAGAGDWCSAVFISSFFKSGNRSITKKNRKNILAALNEAQAYGALNCCFYGARGIMYSLDKKKLKRLIEKVKTGKLLKIGELNLDVDQSGSKLRISDLV